MDEMTLQTVRQKFARQVMEIAGLNDVRLENALGKIHREDFLGPGPWQMLTPSNDYEATPDSDPVHLYQDRAVGILPEKGLNNGQPSFLALLISLGRPAEGERFVHVGAGTGYYTAIVSRLVGQTGSVQAIEREPELAERARLNLSAFSNVSFVHADGAASALDPSDTILVNAGAVCPEPVWLDALKDGGRLILPLTVPFTTPGGHKMTMGGIFLIARAGDAFHARWASPTGIYPCFRRDPSSETALSAAFAAGGGERVTRLYRTNDIPDERCWVRGPGWALAYH